MQQNMQCKKLQKMKVALISFRSQSLPPICGKNHQKINLVELDKNEVAKTLSKTRQLQEQNVSWHLCNVLKAGKHGV